MSKKEKNKRAYTIIEPDIYTVLDWDMDAIVACLEVIRTKLPEIFLEFPKSIQYTLLPLENPFGKAYPVIGLYSNTPEDLAKIPKTIDLDEKVEHWLQAYGM